MGRIGNEAALAVHGLRYAGEQPVDGHHKRAYFGRQVLFVNGMQFLFGTLVDLCGEGGDGPEQLAHQIADHQQQHGEQDQEGQQTAPGTFAGVLVAGIDLLGDGNALAVGGGPDQHASLALVPVPHGERS